MAKNRKKSRSEMPDSPCVPSVLYYKQFDNWCTALDLLGGTERMRDCGETYLPKEPAEKQKDYNIRLNRSFLYNGYKGAVSKIVSYPFSRHVALNLKDEEQLPEQLDDLEENVDGAGTTLTAYSRDAFEAMIALGHVVLFVDYTNVQAAAADQATADQVEATGSDATDKRKSVDQEEEEAEPEISKGLEEEIGARHIFKIIKATDVIGWEHDDQGKLVQMRWREVKVEKKPNKKWVDVEREYVHIWDADGWWQTWRNKTPLREENTVLGTYLGTDVIDWTTHDVKGFELHDEGKHTFNGGIPFKVLYANKTGPMMSEPPLMELAQTNLEHWQSNSDQRNILRHARLAQKVISGASGKDTASENLKASVNNAIILKDPAAQAYFLEHSGAGIESGRNDLKDLEERMSGQGLQPLTQRTISETATSTMVDLMNVTTDTQAWISEMQDGLKWAYKTAGEWIGVELPEGFEPHVYRDFTATIAGSQDFVHVKDMRASGEITQKTKLHEAQRRGILSEVIDVEAEIAATEAEKAESAAKAAEQMGGGAIDPEAMAGEYTTSIGPDGHMHYVTLDDLGDGTTTDDGTESHSHEVTGGEVQPAGSDMHTHTLEKTDGEEDDEEGDPEGDPEDEKLLGDEKKKSKLPPQFTKKGK